MGGELSAKVFFLSELTVTPLKPLWNAKSVFVLLISVPHTWFCGYILAKYNVTLLFN